MPRITGKAKADSILNYLHRQRLNQEPAECDAYGAAWLLVYYQFFSPHPKLKAVLTDYGVLKPPGNSPDVRPLPFGIHYLHEVDGRNHAQWRKSISLYLEWRSGAGWRRLCLASERFHPEMRWYFGGLHFLNTQAWRLERESPWIENFIYDARADRLRHPALVGKSPKKKPPQAAKARARAAHAG